MIHVVFVCLGNICRSPMGELIFKDLVQKEGLSSSFTITSAGTSDEEEGHAIYYYAAQELKKHGVAGEHRAVQLRLADVVNADYVLVMDSNNLKNVLRLTGGYHAQKVFRLCDFTSCPRDVSDPWYTRDFATAYRDIEEGCKGFLQFLKEKHAEALNYDRRH